LEIAWTLYSPEVRHRAVSASGILGGTTSGPAVWMPNGTGGYTVTTLANAGAVNGVRRDGGMLVGFTSGPVYWLAQPGGRWSAPARRSPRTPMHPTPHCLDSADSVRKATWGSRRGFRTVDTLPADIRR